MARVALGENVKAMSGSHGLIIMLAVLSVACMAGASQPSLGLPLPAEQATETATPTATETLAPTATPSATPLPTETATAGVTPSDTPAATATETAPVTPTDTPIPTETEAATAAPSVTSTPSPTASLTAASPTFTEVPPTATPQPQPNLDFLFAGSGGRPQNESGCAFDLALSLGLFGSEQTFQSIADSDSVVLRNEYQVIYVAPGLNSDDYTRLHAMVESGGVIEQFVNLGGVAVINAAGTQGDQDGIAPDGVGFTATMSHDDEVIQDAEHPYITGVSFGGEALGGADFSGWEPTDRGTLSNLPAGATTVLANSDGVSWAEYPHGNGRVIVTTLTYCTQTQPGSQQAAAGNLLRYSRFYSGAANTPAATVTARPPTRTPTPTSTATATATCTPTPPATPTFTEMPSATEVPSGTSTPTATKTATPPACAGDCNDNNAVTVDEILAMVNIALDQADVSVCEAGDVNHDGFITVDEILIAVANALNSCPTPPPTATPAESPLHFAGLRRTRSG